MSISSTRSESPLVFSPTPNAESEEWLSAWKQVMAQGKPLFETLRVAGHRADRRIDLIDSPVVAVDAETSVEEACEVSVMYEYARSGAIPARHA